MDIGPPQVLLGVLGVLIVMVLAIISGAFFMGKLARSVEYLQITLNTHTEKVEGFIREQSDMRERVASLEAHGEHAD